MGASVIRLTRVASLLVIASLFLCSPAMWAHAVLVRSTPARSATVKGPEVAIELTFNSRLDKSRCTITVVRPDGTDLDLKISEAGGPNQLRTTSLNLTAGSYRIRWQALSNDGHVTHGEIPFQVQ